MYVDILQNKTIYSGVHCWNDGRSCDLCVHVVDHIRRIWTQVLINRVKKKYCAVCFVCREIVIERLCGVEILCLLKGFCFVE